MHFCIVSAKNMVLSSVVQSRPFASLNPVACCRTTPLAVTLYRLAMGRILEKSAFSYVPVEKSKYEISTTPSCCGSFPVQKIWYWQFSTRAVFSHAMPKMDLQNVHYSHHLLVEKKHFNLIYHMPWLYPYPPFPFHIYTYKT